VRHNRSGRWKRVWYHRLCESLALAERILCGVYLLLGLLMFGLYLGAATLDRPWMHTLFRVAGLVFVLIAYPLLGRGVLRGRKRTAAFVVHISIVAVGYGAYLGLLVGLMLQADFITALRARGLLEAAFGASAMPLLAHFAVWRWRRYGVW